MTNVAAQEMKESAADQGKQNVDMTTTKEPENRLMRGKGEKREGMAAVMRIEGKKEEKNGREEVQAVMRIEGDEGR